MKFLYRIDIREPPGGKPAREGKRPQNARRGAERAPGSLLLKRRHHAGAMLRGMPGGKMGRRAWARMRVLVDMNLAPRWALTLELRRNGNPCCCRGHQGGR